MVLRILKIFQNFSFFLNIFDFFAIDFDFFATVFENFNHGFRSTLREICYWENEEKETADCADYTDFFTTPAFAGAGSEKKKHEELL